MKVLITGVDGFIGKKISEKLKNKGHIIIGLSFGKNPPESVDVFYRVDITRREEVVSAVREQKPELCIHLAAMAHADIKEKSRKKIRDVNVQGTANIAEAIEKAGTKYIIYFSSAKVIRDTTEKEGIDETTVPKPIGIYAECKHESEKIIQKINDRGKIESVIIRPVAVIGESDEKGNYTKMRRMVERGFFPLLNGGVARRSVIFLRTLVKRIEIMVDAGLKGGAVYTFEDGDWRIIDIVDAMRINTGYAFCPKIDVFPFQRILSLLATECPAGQRLTAYLEKHLSRLTESFVIKSHLWEKDYGAIEKIDLLNEYRFIRAEESKKRECF